MRLRRRLWPLVILAAALVAACNTRTIRPREPLPAGPGLTAAEVAAAIEGAAKHCNLYRYRMLCWKIVGRAPGSMTIDGNVAGLWLQLAVDYDERGVVTRIVDSSGFEQDGDQIHRNAIRVQGWLEERIEEYLRKALVRKSMDPGTRGAPPSAAPAPSI